MGEEELGNMHFDVDLGIIEETATEVADDGTVVSEQVTAIIDAESGEAIIDSAVDITTTEGAKIHEETLSVVDDEGHVEIIGEEASAEES